MNFKLFIAYISLLHAGPILNLFGLIPGTRVFPITAVGHLLMVVVTFRRFLNSGVPRRLSILDTLVIAFALWSAASFILYYQNGNPSDIRAYFYGVHMYLLPIFGYFSIKALSRDDQSRVLQFALRAYVLLFTMGIVIWWARPEFYTSFHRNVMLGDSDLDEWKVYARLQSYLGSTTVGLSSGVAIILAIVLPMGVITRCAILALSLVCSVLSYQRGGIIGAIMATFFFLAAPGTSRIIRTIGVSFFVFLAVLVLPFLVAESENGLTHYFSREEDFGRAFESRSGYPNGARYIAEFPFGVGLGGSGGAAYNAGWVGWGEVVDANFMRIAADLGIQGVLLFLLIMGFAVRSSIKTSRIPGFAVIIAIYAIICLGTNVFDGHISPHMFWIILGIADTAPNNRPQS